MKKFLSLVLVTVLALSLFAACGSKEEAKPAEKPAEKTEAKPAEKE